MCYIITVVLSANLMIELASFIATVSWVNREENREEGAEHTLLGVPHIKDQRGGGVVAYPPHLGLARQEV
jgi:hypothetical protein